MFDHTRRPKSLRSQSLGWVLLNLLICVAVSITIAKGQDEESKEEGFSLDQLLEAGQSIWEELAPAELKEEYRFPTMDEVTAFLSNVEAALADGDARSLAEYADSAKSALLVLKNFEGTEGIVDWLEPRIDYLTASEEIQEATPLRQEPTRPGSPPAAPPVSPQFTQQYWNQVMAGRPKPKLADRYIPVFKKEFERKGVPTILVWISEVESSINLKARSPVGAYGPFQFMPATAKRFGLRVGWFDERTDPRKSAEAAASYLSILYKQFRSWSLALAAYNAGEGRVGRALDASGSKTFHQVSPRLPTQTRMYVPKVLATIAVRESVDPASLSFLFDATEDWKVAETEGQEVDIERANVGAL